MNWWEWVIQPAVAFIAFIGLIVVNLLVWVFAWGKRAGRINTKIKSIEGQLANPQILPDCNVVFTEIKEKLSDVGGKVEAILVMMKTNQKVDERKRVNSKDNIS